MERIVLGEEPSEEDFLLLSSNEAAAIKYPASEEGACLRVADVADELDLIFETTTAWAKKVRELNNPRQKAGTIHEDARSYERSIWLANEAAREMLLLLTEPEVAKYFNTVLAQETSKM